MSWSARLPGLGVYVLAAGVALLGGGALAGLMAIGHAVGLLLLWGAFGDEPIAGPVVALVVSALPPMFGDDGAVAVLPLASCALAFALGEVLAITRERRLLRVGATAPRMLEPASLVLVLAVTTMVVVIAVTALPGGRVVALAAVVAIGVIALAADRKRRAVTEVSLPPPAPPGA